MSRESASDFNIKAILAFLSESEEALSQRIRAYEGDKAETERGQERLRVPSAGKTAQEHFHHLSDGAIKVLLECRKRDEHHGVPRSHIDDLRDLGLFAPDYSFVLQQQKGVPEEEQPLAHREAIIALLDSDIPLSRPTRQSLKRELMSKWWPEEMREQKREHARIMAELMRAMFELAKAVMPLPDAWNFVAQVCGRNSGEALRKALQPNRLNRLMRRPRRRPHG